MRQCRVGRTGRDRTPEPEPVQVHLQGTHPQVVEWRGRRFAVAQVLATWCIEGRWWLDGEHAGIRRRYFRLCLQTPRSTSLCVEIFCSSAGHWRLWRIAD